MYRMLSDGADCKIEKESQKYPGRGRDTGQGK